MRIKGNADTSGESGVTRIKGQGSIRSVLLSVLALSLVGPSIAPAGMTVVASEDEIVFVSERTGNMDLFAIRPDGTGLRQVTTRADDDNQPAWSPDGSRIAFAGGDPATDSAFLYIVSNDGSDLQPLTGNGDCPPEFDPCTRVIDSDPSWAPDGGQLVFQRMYRTDNLYIIDADGGGERQLTTGLGPDVDPSWSPDGQTIVFASHRDNASFDIFTITPEGTDLRQLAAGTGADIDPSWSPDGSKIVFASDRDSLRSDIFDIYIMNADGSGLRRLTTDVSDDRSPTWSPDGARIAFKAIAKGTSSCSP